MQDMQAAETQVLKAANFLLCFIVLSVPTNAQHKCSNNILYVVCTPTCFDATESPSGSLILLLC